MAEHAAPGDLTAYDRELPLLVERARAAFASWYEFFPRSATTDRRATARSARPRGCCRASPSSGSTWCTCRRSTRSA
jgi:hypothetical protein